MKQLAIFDLDGTVIDSMWAWKNVSEELLEKYNIVPDDDIKARLNRITLKGAAELFIEHYHLDKDADTLIQELCDIVADKYHNVVGLKEDIVEFLDYLKQQNIRMCIATACNLELAKAALIRLNIIDYFEFILTCDELNTTKHSPLIYEVAAARLGGSAENATVYEDSLHTVITAKKAGFEVIAIHDEWEAGNHELIAEHSDKFIHAYRELIPCAGE